jgi:hypothetical protein
MRTLDAKPFFWHVLYAVAGMIPAITPRGGPAPSGTIPADQETTMDGYILLYFVPENLGIVSGNLPSPDKDGELSEADRKGVRNLLSVTPLAGFRVANNTNNNGFLRFDGKRFRVRVNLLIDPRTGRLTAEAEKYVGKESLCVDVVAWVSVDRSKPDCLSPGIWNDPDSNVGVIIENDPTKDDPTRMYIHVVAPSLVLAREALIATLEGTKRPAKSWVT